MLELEDRNLPGEVDSLRVSHVTSSSSTAEDRDHDIVLILEHVADVSSSVVNTSNLDSADLAISKDNGTSVSAAGEPVTYSIVAQEGSAIPPL